MKFPKMSALVLALSTAGAAQAAPFTAGNLLIERIGTGASALTSAATAVFVDEYTTSGTLVQSVALPTSGANQTTTSGTATSEGLVNLSTNGSTLLVPGYSAAVGTTSIAGTTAAAAPREATQVSLNGTVTGSTTFGTLLSGNNVRSAASVDGMNIYASGANGIVYAPAGGSAVSINSTNTRDLEIAGGQLYYSTGSGTQGIYALGNGLPTAAGATGSLIAAVTNPYAFYFADLSSSVAGLDTLFVAVDTTTASTSGLFKFTKSAAGTWSASGSITGTVLRGLTATVNNGQAQLFATNDSKLFGFADAGYGTTLTGALTTLATASANTAFRGLDVTAAVPEPSSYAIALAGLAVAGTVARRRKAA